MEKERIKQLIFELRMELAFHRQHLRDRSEELPQWEVDAALDRINLLLDAIQILEKKL